MKSVRIGNKLIGKNQPVFVIAEAGINHNGDLKIAKKLIRMAKECSADAVKFQSFTADKLVSKSDPSYKRLKSVELKREHHFELIKTATDIGIMFLTSVFDEETVDFLETFNLPCYKIASCDLTNIPLIKYVAKKQRPIILSTGMGTLEEISSAVSTIKKENNNNIILLHCVSCYPPKAGDINLRAISLLEKRFRLPVGFSDHSMEISIPIAAVALGAVVIEKHITLDRHMPGFDQNSSTEPHEFKRLINEIRIVEKTFGSLKKKITPAEEKMAHIMRRSLVWSRNYSKGTRITWEMLDSLRPGTGIPPTMIRYVVGKRLCHNVKSMFQVKTRDYY